MRSRESAPVADGRGLGRSERSQSESGAILILALVYIIAISLIVGGLARWATDDLDNTNNFGVTSQLRYAVTGAMNTAMESIRYTPLPTTTPTQNVATGWGECWVPASGSVSQLSFDNKEFVINVYCNVTENLDSSKTRIVSFAACLSSVTATSCEQPGGALLSAVVNYDDYPAGGGILLTAQCNVLNLPCGQGQALKSWIWQ